MAFCFFQKPSKIRFVCAFCFATHHTNKVDLAISGFEGSSAVLPKAFLLLLHSRAEPSRSVRTKAQKIMTKLGEGQVF